MLGITSEGISAGADSAHDHLDPDGLVIPVGYLVDSRDYRLGRGVRAQRWRRPGPLSAIPALLASELPFIVGYLLIALTALAFVDGDLSSPGGIARAVVALLVLAGLLSWCGARFGACRAAQRRKAKAAVEQNLARPLLLRTP